MINISNRLKAIASLVKPGSIIGDIGSDHGLLPLYLFENKIINKAYACDNKIGPFSNLKETFKDLDYDIELKLSSGINDLPEYVNTLTITGMGGDLINEILFNDESKLKNVDTLILSPQSNIPELRKSLVNHHYKIVDEIIILDDKFYTAMVLIKGDQILKEIEEEFGPVLLTKQSQEFVLMLNQELNYQNDLLKLKLSSSRIEEVNKRIALLKEALCYQKN